ncbi:MAG: AarF/ABC1/UbiB kinase family protein, partial [SAR202 cluster bacterium]|nr:AarF/ABC1/UbiB kinase family protein [SAR202 cluster bacterium]
EISQTVTLELGGPINSVFAAFDPNPIGVASIGQVHAATLPDGSEVVVKVRKPGVVDQVQEDLEILYNLAAMASKRWDVAKQYDMSRLVQEFSDALRAELDYVAEGKNIEHFAQLFRNTPEVHIPKIYWEYSTPRMITMEHIKGVRLADAAEINIAGVDRNTLAERGVRIWLKMIFENGFFHADPHPGNLVLEPNGRLGLIDFGMVGTIDEQVRDSLLEAVRAVADQDADKSLDALEDMDAISRVSSREALRRDLLQVVGRYQRLSVDEVRVGFLLDEIFAMVRQHRLQLPTNVFLLLKTLAMAEGVGTRLDPDFDMVSVLKPYAEKEVRKKYSFGQIASRIKATSADALMLGLELPKRLRRIARSVERQEFRIAMEPVGVDPYLRRLEKLANRLALAIITGSLIAGLAVLTSVYRPAGENTWVGIIFALGLIVAISLGGYLAWSILRSQWR